jgi:hypothetical protein
VGNDGKLWMFSGQGLNDQNLEGGLSDIWAFDTISLQWSWQGGGTNVNEPPTDKSPGSRPMTTAHTFHQRSNQLYIWGGRVVGSLTFLADLWILDMRTLSFTKVSSAPIQGELSCMAMDSEDNLYMSGGQNYQGPYDMLLTYSIRRNSWTQVNAPLNWGAAYHGLLGSFSRDYRPGTCWDHSCWQTGDMFFIHCISTFWGYNVTSKEWAWLGGNPPEAQDTFRYQNKYNVSSDLPIKRFAATPFTDFRGGSIYGENLWPGTNLFGDMWKILNPVKACDGNHTGNQCQYFVCNGLSSNDVDVCFRKGICIAPNLCQCSTGYTGKNSFQSPFVCSGFGNCSLSSCKCQLGHIGDNCELDSCNGIANVSQFVCSGKGSCTKPDLSTCTFYFSGINCEAFALGLFYQWSGSPILFSVYWIGGLIFLCVIILDLHLVFTKFLEFTKLLRRFYSNGNEYKHKYKHSNLQSNLDKKEMELELEERLLK